MDPDKVDVDVLLRRAEIVLGCLLSALFLWQFMPATVTDPPRRLVDGIRHQLAARQQAQAAQRQLESELWHVRHAMADYNRHHDRQRFASSLGFRCSPSSGRDQVVGSAEDG